MNTTALQFGVNPYDRCPNERKRYHVVDPHGFIRFKSDLGCTGLNAAGNYSDRELGVFAVIDTSDGSEYGACESGEIIR